MEEDGAEPELERDPCSSLPILNLENEKTPEEDRAELGGVVILVTVEVDTSNGRRWLLLPEDTVSLCFAGYGDRGWDGFFMDERAGGGGRATGVGELCPPRGYALRGVPRGRRCGVRETWRPMAICSMVGGAVPMVSSSLVTNKVGVVDCGGIRSSGVE